MLAAKAVAKQHLLAILYCCVVRVVAVGNKVGVVDGSKGGEQSVVAVLQTAVGGVVGGAKVGVVCRL